MKALCVERGSVRHNAVIRVYDDAGNGVLTGATPG